MAWLAEVSKTFEELGLQARAAVMARLRTEFDLAARGIDPHKLARVESFRRQFKAAAWTRVLTQAEVELHEALAPEEAKLQNAETQLGKLLLGSLQAGVLSDADLRQAHAEAQAERLWYRIAADTRFELLCRQLLLEVIVADAAIIVAALARRISPLLPAAPQPDRSAKAPRHPTLLPKTFPSPVEFTPA